RRSRRSRRARASRGGVRAAAVAAATGPARPPARPGMPPMSTRRWGEAPRPTASEALALAAHDDSRALADAFDGDRRDTRVSYSRKVFVPLTQLCRDVCHYCTFARTPRRLDKLYLEPDDVLDIARAGTVAGCKEALFTLGDRPEARYPRAREALARL